MLSKMTISKRIMFGYIISAMFLMLVAAGSIIQSIFSLRNSNTVDAYNKADIISNDALDSYTNARTGARDIYLTKTYSDETYNDVINALGTSINILNADFANFTKDFIDSKHKKVINDIIDGISGYKSTLEKIYGVDREKLKLEQELVATGDELLDLFELAELDIKDSAAEKISTDSTVVQIADELESIHDFQSVVGTFWKARVAIRNILFMDDIAEYDAIKEYFRSINSNLGEFESILRNSSRLSYEKLLTDLQTYEQIIDQYRDLAVSTKELGNELTVLASQNSENIQLASSITITNLNESISFTNLQSFSFLISSITLLIVSSLVNIIVPTIINKSIDNVLKPAVSELSEAAATIADASGNMKNASGSLAQGNSEQAASIEETSSTMNETATMIIQNTQNTYQAAELSKTAKNSASKGAEQSEDLNEFMKKLNNSADKISKVISEINSIASQTNILALNASVEAARAGESGKSFSVVAEEVRNLAQRSTQAAESTAGIIEDTISLSKEGVGKSQSISESLKEIQADSEKVAQLLNEISYASEEQSRGVEQVNSSMSQMEKISQSTAAVSEESAAAANELQNQAVTLRSVTQRIQVLVGNDI